MDFNNLRAQFNHLQVLICTFMRLPSFKNTWNLYFFPWHLLFLTIINKETTFFFSRAQQNNKQDTKLSKEFYDRLFKNIWHMLSSHQLPNANKSPICLFKVSIISVFRTWFENKPLPFWAYSILKIFPNHQVTKFLLEKSKSLRVGENFDKWSDLTLAYR